jgi:hypothetical protein
VDDEAHTACALSQALYNWIKWNVLFDWNLFVLSSKRVPQCLLSPCIFPFSSSWLVFLISKR